MIDHVASPKERALTAVVVEFLHLGIRSRFQGLGWWGLAPELETLYKRAIEALNVEDVDDR